MDVNGTYILICSWQCRMQYRLCCLAVLCLHAIQDRKSTKARSWQKGCPYQLQV